MSDSPAAPCRIPPSPDDGLSSVAVRRTGKRRYLVLWFDGVRVVAEDMWLKCVVAGRPRPGQGSAPRRKRVTPQGSRRADRILAAPFEPAVPAPTQLMEVVAPHLRAVSIEVDPNLVPGAAARTAALIREGRERRS